MFSRQKNSVRNREHAGLRVKSNRMKKKNVSNIEKLGLNVTANKKKTNLLFGSGECHWIDINKAFWHFKDKIRIQSC